MCPLITASEHVGPLPHCLPSLHSTQLAAGSIEIRAKAEGTFPANLKELLANECQEHLLIQLM